MFSATATRPPEPGTAAVDLFWLPLGAGGWFVRRNGRAYEALMARIEHRPRFDLYHSALEVRVDGERFVIEMTPVRDDGGDGHVRRGGAGDDARRGAVGGDHVDGARRRGAVAGGAVGSRWAGRLRIFRYEVRRWRDGLIPDVGEAVDSPRRLSADPVVARRVLELVLQVPTPVWGRDELRAGDMWNSNSLIAWLIECSGLDAASIEPPVGGRAPGWDAGVVVAGRSRAAARVPPPDQP
ncbi:hypothetical protein [Conexibacter sp. CPCC 206217]|uniref:hypothetical protein n=1 Tax=Conexibacter sp. CPCC 206217 TaxID=3064574 RepID=UPI002717261E|nr:hypothetical protein [Conexibacter sp. CPCC 206217]MDO8212453.1 hypothetical protein [Conexibacter sp. CPCC 206217]